MCRAANAGFDQAFLERAFEKLGQTYDLRVCDTLELFRRTWPESPKHGLRDLCRNLSIECAASHRALDDCSALLELIKRAAATRAPGRDSPHTTRQLRRHG
jgi:DNA polymerase III epsilon subunit-like protein